MIMSISLPASVCWIRFASVFPPRCLRRLLPVFLAYCRWVLVRYSFFGKRFFHALIDFPFALPTAVAGIVLATIFQPSGFLGKFLIDTFGLQVALSHWVS